MTPHSFWYQEGSAASLRLHSKADVAMSTSCIIREAQLYRPQAACPFFYSRCEFPLLPLVFLLLGFKFWLSQLSVLPKHQFPRDLSCLHHQQVSHWRMWSTFPAQLRLQSLLQGLPGKAPLPLPPAGAQVSASTLSNPVPEVFYLHHLSPQPRDEKLPLTATHSTRLSGSWSNSLLATF